MQLEKVIAHRGASAYAPENTMAAFNKALTLDCRFIEFDVICSKDGEPFVFHDEKLKRTTNGQGNIGEVDAEYLNTLDAGKWFSKKFKGEKIPHFRDVLKWLAFSDVQANIEIKPYPRTTEDTTITVLSYINRYWPQNKDLPLISSFDDDALFLSRSISPEMPLGLLIDTWDAKTIDKAKQLNCVSVHLNRKIVTEERVTEFKKNDFLVLAYTINRKRQAKKLLSWGVDSIFSDYPDLLK